MADDDTLDTSPAPDTSTAAPAPADTQPPDTQPTATPEASNAATPAQPDAEPAPSQPDPRSQNPSPTGQPAAPSVDWQSRYRELQSYADRRSTGYMSQIQELQQKLTALEQARAQQEKQAQIKRWSPEHPEHAKFKGLLSSAKTIHRQLQDLDRSTPPAGVAPEQHAANVAFAKERIIAGLSADEQAALGEYQQDMQEWQTNLFTEPEKAIGPIARRMAEQVFAEMQAKIQGQRQWEEDSSQPHMKPILENPRYAGELQDKLQRGVPYKDAMESIKLRAAVDLMAAKLSGADRQATHAQEQVRLAQGRAARTTTADPAPSPVDPYKAAMKEATAKGIVPGTPAFNRLLDKYERANT